MISNKLLRQILPNTLWGDRLYSRYRFYKRLGRLPKKHPIYFNDYLFALKTSGIGYDPLVKFVTDKEHAKLYVLALLGKKFVIETYHILRKREELENFFPDRFPCILKPTHASGKVALLTNSSTPLDRKTLGRWFDTDYYKGTRENNYRYLIPKIIVEEFFSEDGHTVPKDYKVFCFAGAPKFIQVDSDRFSGHTRNLYDTNWVRIPATYLHPSRERDDPKPALLDEMLHIAQKLSAPFPFVRVDMYATTTELKVGELTFFPEGASGLLKPAEAEYMLGAYFREANTESKT